MPVCLLVDETALLTAAHRASETGYEPAGVLCALWRICDSMAASGAGQVEASTSACRWTRRTRWCAC